MYFSKRFNFILKETGSHKFINQSSHNHAVFQMLLYKCYSWMESGTNRMAARIHLHKIIGFRQYTLSKNNIEVISPEF